MNKPMKFQEVTGDEAYQFTLFTVVSRVRDDKGMPINGPHTLWETCVTKDEALRCGQMRSDLGYWVDVFQNVEYNTALVL